MNGEEPTRFIDANALLAVMDGDIDGARDYIAEMSTAERRELAKSARRLAQLCEGVS